MAHYIFPKRLYWYLLSHMKRSSLRSLFSMQQIWPRWLGVWWKWHYVTSEAKLQKNNTSPPWFSLCVPTCAAPQLACCAEAQVTCRMHVWSILASPSPDMWMRKPSGWPQLQPPFDYNHERPPGWAQPTCRNMSDNSNQLSLFYVATFREICYAIDKWYTPSPQGAPSCWLLTAWIFAWFFILFKWNNKIHQPLGFLS